MARDIREVIKRILAEVPLNNADLRESLHRIAAASTEKLDMGRFGWHPPELSTALYWTRLQNVLVATVIDTPGDRPVWLERVRRILTGEA